MLKNSKLKKLKKLKRDYSNERKGYRDRQYDILADTMAIVVELRSDQSAVKAFLKLSGKKSPKETLEKYENWLTSAVIAYVTGAKSENAIKLAWKRARGLEHLHDFHGISTENIAAEIRTCGGIEATREFGGQGKPSPTDRPKR